MLTERQIKLLEAIISSYIEKAEPIGSVEVVNNYDLHCSAATIRNEMARLLEMGFLDMPHTSSGRVPTKMAYRFYLDQMIEEEELPVLQEVALKQRLWPKRFEFEKMLREAMISLSEITQALAIATTDDGYMVHAGSVNVLDNKEFWEIEVAKAALTLLDNYEIVEKVLSQAPKGSDVRCMIEEEIGIDNLSRCTLIFSPYASGNKSGHVLVLGPSRMNYPSVIPAVRYTKNIIEELGEAW